MVAAIRMPPVLARRAHKANLIAIIAGGARRMRAVGRILITAAEGEDGKDKARHSAPSLPAEPLEGEVEGGGSSGWRDERGAPPRATEGPHWGMGRTARGITSARFVRAGEMVSRPGLQ